MSEVAVLIDCEACSVRGTGCPDCVISVFLEDPVDRSDPIDLDESERMAVSVLAASGLLPPLRLVELRTDPAARRGRSRRATA
jgi:hypothetical protein